MTPPPPPSPGEACVGHGVLGAILECWGPIFCVCHDLVTPPPYMNVLTSKNQ